MSFDPVTAAIVLGTMQGGGAYLQGRAQNASIATAMRSAAEAASAAQGAAVGKAQAELRDRIAKGARLEGRLRVAFGDAGQTGGGVDSSIAQAAIDTASDLSQIGINLGGDIRGVRSQYGAQIAHLESQKSDVLFETFMGALEGVAQGIMLANAFPAAAAEDAATTLPKFAELGVSV